jgi:glutamine amidotransferase
MISVIDYGAGNVGSVIRMIEKVGGSAQRVSTPLELGHAKIAILPGVGAFDYGMQQLADRGLIEALHQAALVRCIPIMGICLGMQLMCKRSDEGKLPGLGWFDAEVLKFQFNSIERLPIPHMGWNTIELARPNRFLNTDLERSRYYFVHSYYVQCNDASDIVARTTYGERFVSAFERGNLFGAQFHPEKSHRFGMAMIKKFVEWDRAQ